MDEHINNSFYYSLSDMKNLKGAFRDCIIENRTIKKENLFFKTHLYLKDVGQNSSRNGTRESSDINILSYNPTEKKVLAIDLGGTYLKLCVYMLRNEEIVNHTQLKKYKISRDGSLSNTCMFDWVSGKVYEFLRDEAKNIRSEYKANIGNSEVKRNDLLNKTTGNNVINEKVESLKSSFADNLVDDTFLENIVAGVTISYPIKQSALNMGYITEMGKDFPFKKINEEMEIVESLTKSLEQYKIKAQIRVLLNDTTATLASAVRSENVFYIGIVLGTGVNIAFNDNVLYKNQIINSEIAAFDSESLKKNIHDLKIKEDIIRKQKVYKPLDCMLGGYKLVELFNLAFQEHSDKKYTLQDILRSFSHSTSLNYTEEFYVILSIKKRTMRILASLIFGLLEAQKVDTKIKIILNGTIFEQDSDRRIFIDEIRRMSGDSSKYKYKNFTFESICDATLRGIARILLQVK